MRYLLLFSFIVVFSRCSEDFIINKESCSADNTTEESHPLSIEFSGWLDRFYRKGYPGLALAVRDSSGNLFIDTRGYAIVETSEHLLRCHLHHSASVSKTYIAALTLRLNEKGLFGLDDSLADHLTLDSSIQNFSCVTIRQLLGHQSGIYDYDINPKIFVDYLNDPFQNINWKDILNRYVVGEDANFLCGQSTRYSDTNYLLLGVFIEAITGKDLGRVMEDEIFNSLNLTDTYYKADVNYPSIPTATNSYFYFANDKIQNCTDWQEHFADISMGHEGIIASPLDYVNFLGALINKQIVAKESLDSMMAFNLSDESDTELGLGLERITTPYGIVYGHSGGGFGTMTLLFYEPLTQSTFFVGTNVGSIFESKASDLFYDELLNDLVEIIKS